MKLLRTSENGVLTKIFEPEKDFVIYRSHGTVIVRTVRHEAAMAWT